MSATTDFTDFANDVYLIIKNRYIDSVEDEDGQVKLRQTASWVNMFLDELETEVGPDGKPIDWTWARSNGERLGTAVVGRDRISFDPEEYLNLLTGEKRYLQIYQGTKLISNWAVVGPSQIANSQQSVSPDQVALVADQLVFSRNFNSNEDRGLIYGDVTTPLPRITYKIGVDSAKTLTFTNIDVLNLVKPKLLLQLGVAKNASLPDIVQGQLSPSYTQKYGDLLNGAIARSLASSSADEVERDDFSFVGGVGPS